MSRRIEDLRFWFQVKPRTFKKMARDAGHPILITRTLVKSKTQQLLYKVGRKPLNEEEIIHLKNQGVWPGRQSAIVTYAQFAGATAHGCGLAFDCIPVSERGSPIWNTPQSIWKLLYKIAEKIGLDAMGDEWGEFLAWDKGHFAEPGWRLYKSRRFAKFPDPLA